jgi:hypothetical protein
LNANPEAGLARPDECPDVLTPEEEGVLAAVRSVVEGIGARGLALEADVVAGALEAAGLRASCRSGETGAVYCAKGARFELRCGAGPAGGVEIRFVADAT